MRTSLKRSIQSRLKGGLILAFSVILALLTSCEALLPTTTTTVTTTTTTTSHTTTIKPSLETFSYDDVPAYSSSPYVIINDNEPFFTKEDLTTEAFEEYSDLDSLGRCGTAFANICIELMPTAPREEIYMVRPSGWQAISYPDLVDGGSLYNRSHLIAFQLAGENANKYNLITGTRYMNTNMIPFENMVADMVKDSKIHVLYRVTPIFVDKELICRGVLMEAMSVEDKGESILYNVFLYNVQPGIIIDYSNGNSRRAEPSHTQTSSEQRTYILNVKSKRFHDPSCPGVADISEKNKKEYVGYREDLITMGYSPCQTCNP